MTMAHRGATEIDLYDEANPYLRGNFGPVSEETTAFGLTVRGSLPEELDGRFLRIGPNPVGHDPASYHWFVGSGMVHGVRLRAGKAEWYRSRWVMSDNTAAALGRKTIGGPSNGPGSVNTSLMSLAGKTYAIVEAGSLPIEIGEELESISRSDFGGTLEGGYTAHPKRDPQTGETLALAYEPGRPTVKYVVADRAGVMKTLADIPAPHGPMIHDMGFTDRFAIMLDLPVTFQPRAEPPAMFPYIWTPEQTPRVGLLPRSGDLTGMRWLEAPLCGVFHVMNAYDQDESTVIIDLARHPKLFDRDRRGPSEGDAVLVRWTINLVGGSLKETIIEDRGPEFPRINSRVAGQNYRYGYTSQWLADLEFGPLMKHDMANGTTEIHDVGPNCMALEPVFVSRAGASDEDDGYVLAYIFDANRNASNVVVLAAQDFKAPPIAVIELPVRVPFGFHGGWAPTHRR